MNLLLKRLPLPISGLMLALAATGTLLAPYSFFLKNLFGLLSAIICTLLILKLITNYDVVRKDLEHPVTASVSPTFSMGLMILSTYIKATWPSLALGIWILGLILHSLLIISFSKRFLLRFNIKKVFASYFVVYVGIAVGTVTSATHGTFMLGQVLFWFGFISYLTLLPIVGYRTFIVRDIPEPALPTIAIFSAPASLCLAGYMSAFPAKNMLMVWILTSFSLVSLIGVLLCLPWLLRLKFYPSYSAFTFPLVISAIALKKTGAFLNNTSHTSPWIQSMADFTMLVAVCMVLYVLVRFFIYLNPAEVIKSKISA